YALSREATARLHAQLGAKAVEHAFKHANGVEVLDAVALDESTVCLVLEAVAGQTLRSILDERGTLSLEEAYAILLPPAQAFPRAKAAALKALDLDAELAEAHTSLGLSQVWYEWDFAKGEASYKRATGS